eukprot:2958380-Pyramimonas_sp.AAC.1
MQSLLLQVNSSSSRSPSSSQSTAFTSLMFTSSSVGPDVDAESQDVSGPPTQSSNFGKKHGYSTTPLSDPATHPEGGTGA